MNHLLCQRSTSDTAWQLGNRTNLGIYEWLRVHPTHLYSFQQLLADQAAESFTWLDVFPFDQPLNPDFLSAEYAFVDVGGGTGQQSQAFQRYLPEIRGRIVNEDRAEVLRTAPCMLGVDHVCYDYLSAQPIQGKILNEGIGS